ncbi:hypothetical protein HUU05_02625 [candidate division KSB1 bacterium]|nr:hypothetical protein [candidate division KSB1 bacterium]
MHMKTCCNIPSVIALAVLATSKLGTTQSHVEVKYLRTILGDSASAIRLAHPLGMSVDLEDNIYIADTGNHRVVKCNLQGKLLREVGGFGFGEQQFDRPVDVWAGNDLDVFVADYNNQRLQRYDKDLNFISSYISNETGDENLHFGYPAALGLSVQGELFVADHEFNRVLRFDAFGDPKASFGDFNWGEGGLARPAKIFISRRNEVWVSDSSRAAIMVYDTFGNFLRRLGANTLAAPCGIAEWRHGMIVTDRERHALSFLGREGESLGEFGERGKGTNAFEAPAAVALLRAAVALLQAAPTPADRKDASAMHMLVLDSGNHRVQLFEIKWQP